MYEFEIMNKTTCEEDVIYGYSYKDALRRRGLDETEYKLLRSFYID